MEMGKIFRYIILLVCLLINKHIIAQVNFLEDFNIAPIGWTGNITHTTLTNACGSPSMRRNLFFPSAQSGNLISPLLGTSVSGTVTLTYKYKVANWIANTIGTSDWGSFNVQYGASPTGPWTTIQTINTANHVVSGSCSTVTVNFVPPSGALYLKWDAFYNTAVTTNDYYLNFDDIVVTETGGLSCSGIPSPGNTLANTDSACNNQPFNLSLQNVPSGAGITYQWQSADDASFTNNLLVIPSTTFSVTTSQATAKYYRCAVTCAANTTMSNTIFLGMKAFTNCYCTAVPTSIDDYGITNVLYGTFSNPNLEEAEYQDYKSIAPGTIQTSSTVPITCNLETGYTWRVWAFVDFNQNGSFTDAGEGFDLGLSTATPTATLSGNIIVPSTALLGNTGLRIVGTDDDLNITPCFNNSFGNVEDYLINIIANTACSGIPIPGNTLSSEISPLCAVNTGALLSLQNTTIGTGVTYQWYNGAGIISGANASTYSTGVLINKDSFYCAVTCGVNTSNSNIIVIDVANVIIGSSITNPILVGQAPCLTNIYTNIKNPTIANCYNNLLPTRSTPEVYYQFSLANPTTVKISHCGSGFDTHLSLLDNTGAIITTADDNGPLCAGIEASLSYALTVGTYYVASEGYNVTGPIITSISTIDTCLGISLSATNVTCNGVSDGSIIVSSVPAGVYTYFYESISTGGMVSNGNDENIIDLIPGIYTITVVGSVETVSTTITISQPSPLIGSILNNNAPLCYNGSDGNIIVTGSGGSPYNISPAYSYDWYSTMDSIYNIDADSILNGVVPGNYFVVIEDANACRDTISTTINNTALIASSISDSICSNELPYVWEGNNYNASGIYIDTFIASNNCDSVVTLTLTVLASSTNTFIDTNCDSYLWPINGDTYTSSGLYYDTALNSLGCQHINILNLVINASTSSSVAITATGSYVWPLNGITYSISGIYSHASLNSAGCNNNDTLDLTINQAPISIAAKAFLDGPFVISSNLMDDALRTKGYIPAIEPYSSSPYNIDFIHVGGGGEQVSTSILAISGSDAIVDWVFVSLRSAINPAVVLVTKSALIQRDGDIVSSVDGISPISFMLPAGNYYFSVDHRNHLGIMTANAISFNTAAATAINLTNGSIPLYLKPINSNAAPLTGATKNRLGVRTMYSGNCNIGTLTEAKRINYGPSLSSDKSKLLLATGATGTITGYTIFDVDMNGSARYNGINPDRLVISATVLNNNIIVVNEQMP